VCFENCCGVDLLFKQRLKVSLEVRKRDLMKVKMSSLGIGLQTRTVEVQTSRSMERQKSRETTDGSRRLREQLRTR
jgi:hypothetical protein